MPRKPRRPPADALDLAGAKVLTVNLPSGLGGTQPRASEHPSGPNKLESAYSDHLELLRRAGLIRAWDFEPEKLRLAGRCWLLVDFRVVLNSGHIEIHETKGFMRDDASAKLKVAARLHPCFTFWLVRQVRGSGGWTWQRVTPRGGIGKVEVWEPEIGDL